MVLLAASVRHTGPFTKPPMALANLKKGTRSEVNDGGIKATAMVVPSLHSRKRGRRQREGGQEKDEKRRKRSGGKGGRKKKQDFLKNFPHPHKGRQRNIGRCLPDDTRAAGRNVPRSTVDIAMSLRFDLATRTVRNERLRYRRGVNAMHVALQNRRESTSRRTRR